MDEQNKNNSNQMPGTQSPPIQPPIVSGEDVPPPPMPESVTQSGDKTPAGSTETADAGSIPVETVMPATIPSDGTPAASAEVPGAVVPPTPRRKFPLKLIILGLVGIVIIAVVGLLAKNLFNKAPSAKKVSVTWWGLWEEESVVKPLIDDYVKANPNVEIKYVKNSPQDYRERLTNALAKGEGPDIFRLHNSWIPMFSRELDSLPPSLMSAAEYATTFYPVISSDVALGSGLVGIPLGYDALTLFINEDIFASAGMQPPTTWNELRDAAKVLTKIENDQIVQAGVALGRTENVDHWQEILGLMLLQNGADLNNPQGKLVEDALIYFTLFSRVDGVWDETLPASTTMFAGGKLAMYFAPSWRAFEIGEANSVLKFRTVPLPQLPKERPNEPNVSYATYWIEAVSAKSQNKDVAWDFLKFLSTKENLEKFYTNASRSRGFGEAYPRVEMSEMLGNHNVLGSIIKLAPEAQSWYLAARTFDGATGINTQINKYFEDAINTLNQGKEIDKAMQPLTPGVLQVLTQYGLVRK